MSCTCIFFKKEFYFAAVIMMIMHVNTTFMIIKILKNPKDFTPRKFFLLKNMKQQHMKSMMF